MRCLSLLIIVILGVSCKPQKKNTQKHVARKSVLQHKSAYISAKDEAISWIENLHFDPQYIQKKKLGEKKFLAEYLGFYWKLYKVAPDSLKREQLKSKIKPLYRYTKTSQYHNMARIDDKLFKKNSMSYLRVLWLLEQMDFDSTYYRKELAKIQNRLDAQMKIRGNWQREVFKEYYNYFDLELPSILQNTPITNGLIDLRLDFEQYSKNKAYNFTHFIFAAFEYGNKKTQNRFSKEDIIYIRNILPKFTRYYREQKPNIDLLGEFVSCMVYLGFTDSEEFIKSYNYLIAHQNENGSWGSYEKARAKIGDDIDFRAYLHTTLVVLEALLEYNEGTYAFRQAN